MKIAFIIFNNMTALDFIGFFDPVARLKTMGFMKDLDWDICSFEDKVKDDKGLSFIPDKIHSPLDIYDIIFVPGGFGTRALINNIDFISWLKTSANVKLKVSVCTGSLLLGKAGLLKDKRATTHPNKLNELRKYCKEAVKSRIVDEQSLITAGGVTSSIGIVFS